VVMKNYPPQFKADAVAQYQSRPEATIRQVTADLGINSETLRNWVRDAGASRQGGAGHRCRPSRRRRARRRGFDHLASLAVTSAWAERRTGTT
jgi:transposase-like protein